MVTMPVRMKRCALRNASCSSAKPHERREDNQLNTFSQKRFIPNFLTLLRMALAISLLFFPFLSGWFLFAYLLAGISDILDGFFARRWNVSSSFGAKLDSAADFLLCCVLLYRLLCSYRIPLWITFWIAGIALLRLAALATCYVRFQQFAFLHTYSNKATGFLLLCFPYLLRFFGLTTTAILLCAVASVSALEELLIQLTSCSLQLNRPTIILRFR